MAVWNEGLGNEQGYLARGKGVAITTTQAIVTGEGAPYWSIPTSDPSGIDLTQELRPERMRDHSSEDEDRFMDRVVEVLLVLSHPLIAGVIATVGAGLILTAAWWAIKIWGSP